MDGSRADPRPVAWVATAAGTVLALLYAWLTPPGLPYDEPAHWGNVLFYGQHHRMPELGEPGATYEAQMGPGYYAPASLVAALVGDGDVGFYVVRVLGGLLVPVLALLTYRLAMVVQADTVTASFAAGFVALNPLMLAIGGSVQNDYLSIALGTLAMLAAVRLLRDGGGTLLAHAAVGAIIGLAILTKVVAVSLLPALLIAYAAQSAPRAERARRALVAVAGCLAVSGWWFVRNLVVYGDLTGASGMASQGVSFPPMRISGLSELTTWLGTIVSYAFVPVEYYRNVINAPVALEVLAAVTTVAVLAAGGRYVWLRMRRRELAAVLLVHADRVFVVAVVACAVVMYLGYALLVSSIAARLLFVAAPAAAVLLAVATRPPPSRWVAWGVLASFLVVNIWLLASLVAEPTLPVLISG